MALYLNISEEADQVLREAWGKDLDQAALEALVIEGYRAGKFGIADVRRLLKLETRWDAESWLGQRGIYMNYSIADLEADRKTLDRLLGESA